MFTLLITNEKNSTLISQKSQEKQNAYCSLNLCFKPILQIPLVVLYLFNLNLLETLSFLRFNETYETR